MLSFIDRFLNRTTMYRLVLYELFALAGAAALYGLFGVMPYGPLAIAGSIAFITAVCLAANVVLAKFYKAPTNVESAYITAMILALIITPPKALYDPRYLAVAFWASLWAMASKYFLAIGKKHLLNPAAFAVALTAITINGTASWWIGTLAMLPFTLAGGWLIVRKIVRADLAYAFLAASLGTIAIASLLRGSNPIDNVWRALYDTPVLFFASVMLTEPLTTPPTRGRRIAYGALTGLLFAPQFHLGPIYFTPETALLAGNVFSYIVSPKEKLMLKLKEKVLVGLDAYDFVFVSDRKMAFKPGQYLEWTLPHVKPDDRGNRRYFTIASSPTEEDLRMGVKFYGNPSSFKKGLMALKPGDVIGAGQLAGDFTMPEDKARKMVWMAGGIGVTPFRSMAKYLLDRGEKRDVTLFYACKTAPECAYKDLFDEAGKRLGLKTIYAVTEHQSMPEDWDGHRGLISGDTIVQRVPDYKDRFFYLSGPHAMVVAFETTLKKLGVKGSQIKKDYFPGFA